jgi:hypothetical protein
MNERIKELINLSGIEIREYYDENGSTTAELQKFAELIVQECIDIIAPYTVRMRRPGEEYLHPILEIREHFGVEE